MRLSRVVRTLLLAPLLVLFLAIALLRGFAYWRYPALLAPSPVSVAFALAPLGAAVFAAYLCTRHLIAIWRPRESTDPPVFSFALPGDQPRSLGESLDEIAVGAPQRPIRVVVAATFFFSMPVLLVALKNGGSLAAVSPEDWVGFALIELVFATLVVMVLIRVRRARKQAIAE